MATEKFKTLVHFMVHECRERPGRLGAVRLNKALWFADVLAYKMNGVSMTGETYVKREKGPVPAHILSTLRELQGERKILIQEPEYLYDARKFISLVPPTAGLLSDDERAMSASVLEAVCGRTTNEIIDMTHNIIWDAATMGEVIPLFATLAANEGEITEAVLDWANDHVEVAA